MNTLTPISTAATTVIRSVAGTLVSITVTGGTAGTIKIYDNASSATASDLKIDFDSTNALGTYTFDGDFKNGIVIVTSAATKLTVSSRGPGNF